MTAWAGIAERQHQREPAQLAAAASARRATKVAMATAAQHEREHPVAELDAPSGASSAPCGVNDSLGAPRPGRAAEAGAGEPDGAAGDDEPMLATRRRPGRGGAATRSQRRGQRHSHLNVLAVRTVPTTAQASEHDEVAPATVARRAARRASPRRARRTGSQRGDARRSRRTPTRAAHRAAGHEQQVDEVRRGQRRLGAQHAGDEQAERGERGRAEHDREHDGRRPSAACGLPAERERDRGDHDDLQRLDHQQRADLAGEQAGPRGAARSRAA